MGDYVSPWNKFTHPMAATVVNSFLLWKERMPLSQPLPTHPLVQPCLPIGFVTLLQIVCLPCSAFPHLGFAMALSGCIPDYCGTGVDSSGSSSLRIPGPAILARLRHVRIQPRAFSLVSKSAHVVLTSPSNFPWPAVHGL